MTECGLVRMVTVRDKSSSVSGSSASKQIFQPASHRAIRAERVCGGASNSLSRWRSDFSPALVKKSVQQERMLPARGLAMMAMELASGPGVEKTFDAGHYPVARSAS